MGSEATDVLKDYRVELVNGKSVLMLRTYNVVVAEFVRGTIVDAERIQSALELISKNYHHDS